MQKNCGQDSRKTNERIWTKIKRNIGPDEEQTVQTFGVDRPRQLSTVGQKPQKKGSKSGFDVVDTIQRKLLEGFE